MCGFAPLHLTPTLRGLTLEVVQRKGAGHFLIKKLKLKVNESKSRVDKPRNRSLLGFSIGKDGRVYVSDKSIRRFKDRIRELTRRTRGRRIEQVVREVADYLQGWRQYYNYAYQKQRFRELTGWIKRRLRCYLWKQWGRAGYRELRKRGVSRDLAWNTCKSHHVRGGSAAARLWPMHSRLVISWQWVYHCSM